MHKSTFITDLPSLVQGGFIPARGVGEGWVDVDYQTPALQGIGLATGVDSGAMELVLDLNLEGSFTLHLALFTQTGLRVWLDGEKGYREFVTKHGGYAFQECRLHTADLTRRRLHIAPKTGVSAEPAFLGYIRAEPCEAPHKNARNFIATNDGYSWVALDGIESERDVWKLFTPLRDSDYGLMIWGPGGADYTCCHQTQVGTVTPLETTHDFRRHHRTHSQQLKPFMASRGDILEAAVAAARDVDIKIHFCIRVEAFMGPFPNDYHFASEYFLAHPEYRCRDEHGDVIMRLSYAYSQVQEHMLEYFRELLKYSPDGLSLAFNRSLPMMICEEPILAEHERLFGCRPILPDEVDSDEMVRARMMLMNRFLERVRALLDENGLELSCIVPGEVETNQIAGLDLLGLAEKKIFDAVLLHSGGQHALGAAPWNEAYWHELKNKTKVFLYAWGGSNSHVETARFIKENVLETGFAGGFFWDTESFPENPYNWHVMRQGGTVEFLDGVISGDTASPTILPCTWIRAVKLGRYHPGRSY